MQRRIREADELISNVPFRSMRFDREFGPLSRPLRGEKQTRLLAELEAELLSRLVIELERVARGENTAFFMTEELNPFSLPDHRLPSVTRELSELADEAIRLREGLQLPTEGSVGLLFQQALRRASNAEDAQRLGPIRIAASLLTKLRAKK
jgi:hypothetical protein